MEQFSIKCYRWLYRFCLTWLQERTSDEPVTGLRSQYLNSKLLWNTFFLFLVTYFCGEVALNLFVISFFCHILNDRHQEVEEGPPRKHLVLQKPKYSIQNDLIYTSANQAYPSYADDLSISNKYANMNSRITSSALSPYGHRPHYSGIIPAHDSLTGPTVPPPTQEYLETETSTEGSDYSSDL